MNKKNTFSLAKFLHKTSSQVGSTLIELLLYMGLFGFVLAIITNLFLTTLEVYEEAQAVSLIEQQGRFIMNRIHYDMTRADTIVLPAANGDVTNTLTLSVGGQPLSYVFADGAIEYTQGTDNYVLHSDGIIVDAFSFERIGNLNGTPAIQIMATLREMNSTGVVESRDYQTTFGLR